MQEKIHFAVIPANIHYGELLPKLNSFEQLYEYKEALESIQDGLITLQYLHFYRNRQGILQPALYRIISYNVLQVQKYIDDVTTKLDSVSKL